MMGEAKRRQDRLGDGPIQGEFASTMNAMMQVCDDVFNPGQQGADRKIGVVMLVFPFGTENAEIARCNFISNGARREDLVVLFKEMIARFEGQTATPPDPSRPN